MDAADRQAAVLRAIVEEYVADRAAGRVADRRPVPRPRRLERHRPQRDVPARARGLHRPAAHVGGPDPDRPGLPLLRRPLHRRRRAPGRPAPAPSPTSSRSAHSALEDLLHETSQLLARLTSHAAVVVGPQSDAGPRPQRAARRRSQPRARARGRGARRTARSRRRSSRTPATSTRPQVARASAALDAHARASSRSRSARRRRRRRPATRSSTTLVRRGVDALAPHAAASGAEPLYVGGASRIAAEQDAFADRRARVAAARAARAARRRRRRWSATCSTRASPSASAPRTTSTTCATARSCSRRTSSRARPPGTVGVLGPTRMDYQQALAAVAAVSQQLGRHLLG